jgi:hypothetical protein
MIDCEKHTSLLCRVIGQKVLLYWSLGHWVVVVAVDVCGGEGIIVGSGIEKKCTILSKFQKQNLLLQKRSYQMKDCNFITKLEAKLNRIC